METPLTQHIRPGEEPLDLAGYERAGGYQALRRAIRIAPLEVRQEVLASNLRGRGGAGFLTGRKWGLLPSVENSRRPRYLVVNADEMEPGTMKDRMLMEGNPHQLLEGALIAGYAVQADRAYIFLRWEYKLAERRLRKAITEAYHRGYVGRNILGSPYSLDLYLHTSAGRYMCGEEDALLNALEGKRAIPRSRPPHAVLCGLWGKPTLVNNVETLCNVPHIVSRGAAWFRALSRAADGGTKIYGASGRVRRPGLWERPMGTTLGEVFHDCAQGMQEGYEFRGLLPGGASTSFLIEKHMNVSMDFDSVEQAGSRLGTGTIIVLDDKVCPVGACWSLMRFFARESCGWCTPCREGLPWMARALEALEDGCGEPSDIEVLSDHVRALELGSTFCALAPGAVLPIKGALEYFGDDFDRHVRQKRCPWRRNGHDLH